MDFYKKYLKYKQKYIQQKKLLNQGGANITDFKNIKYKGCENTNGDTHCDSVEFTTNGKDIKQENVNWSITNSTVNDVIDISGKYNNENTSYWHYLTTKINAQNTKKNKQNGKNDYGYDLIKTASMESFFNYNNITIIKKDNLSIKKETEFCKLIIDLRSGYGDELIAKKDRIYKLFIDFYGNDIELLNKNDFMEFIITSGVFSSCNEYMKNIDKNYTHIVMFNDGKYTDYLYIIYNKENNEAEYVYYHQSIYTMIYLKLFLNEWSIVYMHEIIPIILLQYIIEELKLKSISNLFNRIEALKEICILIKNNNKYTINRNYDLLTNIKYSKNNEKWRTLKRTADLSSFIILTDPNKPIWVSDRLNRLNYNLYGPIFNNKTQYFDFNNLKIFKNNSWERVPYYIAWAYADFTKNNKEITFYCSTYIFDKSEEENKKIIDVYGLDSGISFKLRRNNHGSIIYSKSDEEYLICDNEIVRRSILMVSGYYEKGNDYYDKKSYNTESFMIPLNNNNLYQLLDIGGDKIETNNIINYNKAVDNCIFIKEILEYDSLYDNDLQNMLVNYNKDMANTTMFKNNWIEIPYNYRENTSKTEYNDYINFLNIIYENILLISIYNNLLNKEQKPCCFNISIIKKTDENNVLIKAEAIPKTANEKNKVVIKDKQIVNPQVKVINKKKIPEIFNITADVHKTLIKNTIIKATDVINKLGFVLNIYVNE